MNLPHQKPLLFAKELILLDENTVEVMCVFPQQPTLPMFIEAAAQSSAAFNTQDKLTMGVVISFKNTVLEESSCALTYCLRVKKLTQINTIHQFSFEALDAQKNTQIASGEFTLLIET
ncbi:MAG: hypothetical protein U9N30_03240 [Campylobacterota bacterium]|nr:hypothetical protein [Campylobacterota bacterium]